MNTDSSELPWNALQHKGDGIPWPALRTFAEAVTSQPRVAQELFEVYEGTHKVALTETCYADLYVPAIFALAAPKLGDRMRCEIGAFLIEKLVAAGRDDDDLGLEVLTGAAGTMGPSVLPAVLDAISRESDPYGAWLFLWDLTLLAAETDDQALRDRVVRACVDLLERTERGETETWEATHAAWTLGKLKCTEYTDLVRRLTKKTAGWFEVGDYQDALKLLEGRLDYTPPKELWEEPVEEWLKSQWKFARDWYAQRETDAGAALDRDLSFDRPQPTEFAPPIPIVESTPKVGRNAPCPCGSGKKYKRCCGSPSSQDMTKT